MCFVKVISDNKDVYKQLKYSKILMGNEVTNIDLSERFARMCHSGSFDRICRSVVEDYLKLNLPAKGIKLAIRSEYSSFLILAAQTIREHSENALGRLVEPELAGPGSNGEFSPEKGYYIFNLDCVAGFKNYEKATLETR